MKIKLQDKQKHYLQDILQIVCGTSHGTYSFGKEPETMGLGVVLLQDPRSVPRAGKLGVKRLRGL
jgi:hypothetical protein